MTCSPQQQDMVVAHLTVTEVKLVFSHIACSSEAIWEDRGKQKRHRFRCLSYLAASYPPRFTTDLAVFLMGNPKDFLSIMTYSPRKQYFVSAPSISAFVSLTSVLAWKQRQCLVVAGYHSTESKSEWISYKW